MNPLILIAEDSHYSEGTLIDRYRKPELAHRYVEMLKAYNELLKTVEALEAEKEALKHRYDKLYENNSIFGGEQTVQNYVG